jgi:hypothetical protein
LHSLLLAAQTLANPLVDRTLVLNGPLVQLGLPDDCVNEQSGKQFGFGFSVAPGFRRASPRLGLSPNAITDFDAEFSISRDGADFTLDYAALTLHDEPTAPTESPLRLKAKRESADVATQRYRNAGLVGQKLSDALRMSLVGVDLETALDVDAPDLVAARLRQFLPETYYEVANAHMLELASIVNAGRGIRSIVRSRPGHLSADIAKRILPDVEVSREVASFIRNYLRQESAGAWDFAVGSGVSHLRDLMFPLPVEASEALFDLNESAWWEAHQSELPYRATLSQTRTPEALENLLEGMRWFFGRFVRHLGPLREAPKPLYGLPEAAAGDSVGRSGEYTAAVLSAHGRRLVDCPIPGQEISEAVPLEQAVNLWLSALDLLSSVRAEERGKLGYEMQLEVAGVSRALDLTAVGVGVSQALPVVVLGLISPPGSLVIFEQPELHLHPDVQAAIADFFLALTRTGRQLLVETHSDYLVNRLRRRSAEAEGSEVSSLVKVFFVERTGGTSQVREVRIAENGNIHEWPAGFLDRSAREVEAIVEAQRAKNL